MKCKFSVSHGYACQSQFWVSSLASLASDLLRGSMQQKECPMSPPIKMQWSLFQLLFLLRSFEGNVNIGWFWKKKNTLLSKENSYCCHNRYLCLSVCSRLCIHTHISAYIYEDFLCRSSETWLWSSVGSMFSGSLAVCLCKLLNNCQSIGAFWGHGHLALLIPEQHLALLLPPLVHKCLNPALEMIVVFCHHT